MHEDDQIKKKYWSRKGFQKAYEEMDGISNYGKTRPIAKRAIEPCPEIVMAECDSKNSKTKPTRCSPRLLGIPTMNTYDYCASDESFEHSVEYNFYHFRLEEK